MMQAFKVLLVVGDCILIGMQPILVYMSKVDGKFLFTPVSVNFLTEITKVFFAVSMLFMQVRKQRPGDRPVLSMAIFIRALKANILLVVPSFLYAINNYLKFAMQLYFKPVTVKMLGNLKVLTIALLLKIIMKRRFSILQWEALCLLLIGISVNQIPCRQDSSDTLGPLSMVAWVYTFMSVTIPSMASVYNEYALKSQYDTNVHLQFFFLFAYGAIFNFFGIIILTIMKGSSLLNVFEGHSTNTMLLVANNAMQGVLSSFFFKYADAILKKYSSTVATIFTGLASAALFGHSLTINFVLGVSIVLISMHQFFAAQPQKLKDEAGRRSISSTPVHRTLSMSRSFGRELEMEAVAAVAVEGVVLRKIASADNMMLLPR